MFNLPFEPRTELLDPFYKEAVDDYVQEFITDPLHSALTDKHFDEEQNISDWNRVFRPSRMGKPALELIFDYFVGIPTAPLEDKLDAIFWSGHSFEAWLHFFYYRSNHKIIGTQNFHSYHNIKGHSDFLLKSPESKNYLVDAKAINHRAFSYYEKCGLQDDRGYATQLALYTGDNELPACIVMLDKSTGDISHAWLTDEMKRSCLARVRFIIDNVLDIEQKGYKGVEAFEEAFARGFAPPIPYAEVNKKEWTGRILPPQKMLYSPMLPLLYQLYEDINPRGERKYYVKDYVYPDHLSHLKPDIEADVFGVDD